MYRIDFVTGIEMFISNVKVIKIPGATSFIGRDVTAGDKICVKERSLSFTKDSSIWQYDFYLAEQWHAREKIQGLF